MHNSSDIKLNSVHFFKAMPIAIIGISDVYANVLKKDKYAICHNKMSNTRYSLFQIFIDI